MWVRILRQRNSATKPGDKDTFVLNKKQMYGREAFRFLSPGRQGDFSSLVKGRRNRPSLPCLKLKLLAWSVSFTIVRSWMQTPPNRRSGRNERHRQTYSLIREQHVAQKTGCARERLASIETQATRYHLPTSCLTAKRCKGDVNIDHCLSNPQGRMATAPGRRTGSLAGVSEAKGEGREKEEERSAGKRTSHHYSNMV